MAHLSGQILLGPAEQKLFAIEDTRERAERLQDQLVPRLKSLLDSARDLICEIYGSETLSLLRMPTTPAHRPEAKKTKAFEKATAGLALEGQHWFFQQRFECTEDRLHVLLFGLRGHEGNPIVRVLKKHSYAAVRLLEASNISIKSSAIGPEVGEKEPGLSNFISRLRIMPEREWYSTTIYGEDLTLPIADLDAAWPALFDFIVLFPIFRAAADLLKGEKDRFENYVESFWKWCDINTPVIPPVEPPPDPIRPTIGPDSAWEGGFKVAFRRHCRREKRLRREKIRTVLLQNNGRLQCEVPGCGFDFFMIYGDLGREFAHVHHKNPLSFREGPSKTALSDLAIVCANCHAMIHRGKKCRNLEDLIHCQSPANDD